MEKTEENINIYVNLSKLRIDNFILKEIKKLRKKIESDCNYQTKLYSVNLQIKYII